MTMHLAHPSLSLSGKKKGKQKFKSAEEARNARELAKQWEKIVKSHGAVEKKMQQVTETLQYKLSTPPGRSTPTVKSLDTGHTGAVTVKQTPQYTGTKILGIGTMHKSNAVPIFNDDEAKSISSMRR